jgi:hypothetical protein
MDIFDYMHMCIKVSWVFLLQVYIYSCECRRIDDVLLSLLLSAVECRKLKKDLYQKENNQVGMYIN